MINTIIAQLLNRRPDSHKYTYGHVLVVGGSPGMVGAPLLAGKAALRVGAGLVTIASSKDVTDKLDKRVEEIMTHSLPSDPNTAFADLYSFIEERKVSVVVIGPGFEISNENINLVKQLIKRIDLPLIIDGGAFSALQDNIQLLNETASKTVILTPHLGEFQRLVAGPLPDSAVELELLAASFANRYSVVLVLKGHPTYVASANNDIYENTTGNPGMATAGTGDVLSGMIAGIVAQGIEPIGATETAVYLHGLAGDIAASQKTEPGMTASDLIETIPSALLG